MDNRLFPGKSANPLLPPEQLNTNIRVANSGVWATLIIVFLLLVGCCIWGIFGRIETTVDAVAVQDGDECFCYVKKSKVTNIYVGCNVRINGKEYTIVQISSEAFPAVYFGLSDRALNLGGFSSNDLVNKLRLNAPLSGTRIQSAKIVIESLAPISFIIN